MNKLLLSCLLPPLLCSCGPDRSVEEPKDEFAISIAVDCNKEYSVDYSTLPVLGSYDRQTAIQLAQSYLGFVTCKKEFPSDLYFKPYFFKPDTIQPPYTAVLFSEGFNKQPALLKVKTLKGPTLLFCFNQMVINCNEAAECECPYDFNRTPKSKDKEPLQKN